MINSITTFFYVGQFHENEIFEMYVKVGESLGYALRLYVFYVIILYTKNSVSKADE